jgi:hypothetical protein
MIQRRSDVWIIFHRSAQDPSIASWEAEGHHLAIAHFYEPDQRISSRFAHCFCYRNYKPVSYLFERSVEVMSGVYNPLETARKFEIKGRPSSYFGANEVRENPCGTMIRNGAGTVITTAILTHQGAEHPEIPNPLTLVSNFS